MATTGHGSRRFWKALTAMLLVACSFHYAVGDEQTQAAVADVLAVPGAVESFEVLFDRGNKLLAAGNSKDAVGILNAAIMAWEQETGATNLENAAAARAAQLLGEALVLEGEDESAASAFARAAAASETVFGRESSQLVASLTGLGLALLRQGQLSDAASALASALQARALKSDKGMAKATQGMIENLVDLVKASVHGRAEEGGSELEAALLAVNHVNRLAWRYFVQNLPFEGEHVMEEVCGSLQREKEEDGSSPSPPRDLLISALLFNVGFFRLAVLGNYKSAAEVLQRAYGLRKAVLGEVHTLTVQARVSRGWALTLSGETLLAVKELTSSAKALLSAGQPHAADRLLRQALQQGYDPLGANTYANAAFTQHINMLKGWGSEASDKIGSFSQTQMDIAANSRLTGKEPAMKVATRTLAEALKGEITDKSAGIELLELAHADKEQLAGEMALLLKR